jgi:ribosomal subunit interface protein
LHFPLQITHRQMETSSALDEHIEAEAEKLEKFFDKIISCRVVVELPHKHHNKGQHFHVVVDLTVPGREIVVGRDPDGRVTHEDPYVAVSEAFKSARRQLKDTAQRRRREVKRHSLEANRRAATRKKAAGDATA